MTQQEIDALVGALTPVIKDYCAREIAKAVAPLENRLDAADQRPDLRFMGAWHEGASYRQGHFVSHDDAIWHAHAPSQGVQPSTANAIWVLAVKAGAR